MTIIANDFTPVTPYTASVVTLGVGQRTKILVTASGSDNDAMWMRSDMDTSCYPGETQPHALAAIYYPKADTNSRPNTTATGWSNATCLNVSNHPPKQTRI